MDMTPEEWTQSLVAGLAQAVTAMVLVTYDPTEDAPDMLREVMNKLSADQGSEAITRIDWDAFTEGAPEQKDVYAISDIVTTAAFYTRLLSRALVQYEDDETGPFDDDADLLGFLKVLTNGLTFTGIVTGNPQILGFVQDFTAYGTNQAVAAGTLKQDPEGEEGDYMSSRGVTPDEIRGPWGLSRDGFISGGFPHADEIYDAIMTQVTTADAVLTI